MSSTSTQAWLSEMLRLWQKLSTSKYRPRLHGKEQVHTISCCSTAACGSQRQWRRQAMQAAATQVQQDHAGGAPAVKPTAWQPYHKLSHCSA